MEGYPGFRTNWPGSPRMYQRGGDRGWHGGHHQSDGPRHPHPRPYRGGYHDQREHGNYGPYHENPCNDRNYNSNEFMDYPERAYHNYHEEDRSCKEYREHREPSYQRGGRPNKYSYYRGGYQRGRGESSHYQNKAPETPHKRYDYKPAKTNKKENEDRGKISTPKPLQTVNHNSGRVIVTLIDCSSENENETKNSKSNSPTRDNSEAAQVCEIASQESAQAAQTCENSSKVSEKPSQESVKAAPFFEKSPMSTKATQDYQKPPQGSMKADIDCPKQSQGSTKATQDCQKPSQGSMKAALDCQKPSQGSMHATVDCQKPSQGGLRASLDCQKPSQDSMQADFDCQKPPQGGMKAALDCQKPSQGSMIAALDCQKPSHVSMNTEQVCQKPTHGSAKIAQDSHKPSQGSTKTTQDYNKPLQSSIKTAQDYHKPSHGSTKTVQDCHKPSQGSAKTEQDYCKPSQGSVNLEQICEMSSQKFINKSNVTNRMNETYGQKNGTTKKSPSAREAKGIMESKMDILPAQQSIKEELPLRVNTGKRAHSEERDFKKEEKTAETSSGKRICKSEDVDERYCEATVHIPLLSGLSDIPLTSMVSACKSEQETSPPAVECGILDSVQELRTAIILAKKEEIELAFSQDCKTFACVASFLTKKDPSIETAVASALRATLQDLSGRCVQELSNFIEHYDNLLVDTSNRLQDTDK